MNFDFEHTYWNHQGAAEAHYEEMEAAGWEYCEATNKVFYRYHRFYNDGDGSPRIQWLIRHSSWAALKSNPEYIDYSQRLEAQATKRIEMEYRRFKRAQLSNQPA